MFAWYNVMTHLFVEKLWEGLCVDFSHENSWDGGPIGVEDLEAARLGESERTSARRRVDTLVRSLTVAEINLFHSIQT